MSSSVGMMTFPIYGKNVPNHHPVLYRGNKQMIVDRYRWMDVNMDMDGYGWVRMDADGYGCIDRYIDRQKQIR